MFFLFSWLAASLFLGLLWALVGRALVRSDVLAREECAPARHRSDPGGWGLDLSIDPTP